MTRNLDSNSKAMNSAQVLRQQAEAIFTKKSITNSATDLPIATDGLSLEDTKRLVHELQVHQIELEMQNEELKRAQFELDASRSRYYDLYELAPTGYCIVSEQGLIEEANLTTAKLLGVDRSRLINRPVSRFLFKEDQDSFYLNYKQILKTDELRSWELRMLTPDGNFVWVQMACVAIEDTEGILKVRMILTDITERKLVEEKLQSKTAFFQSIADCSTYGLLVVGNEGKKIQHNARFLALYDIPPEIARDPDNSVQLRYVSQRTKAPQAFLDRITYCNAHPEFTGYDEIELINGTVIDSYTAPVRNNHGGFYGRIWTFRDVTEQKHAQRLEAETLESLRKISSHLPGVIFKFRIRPDGSSCFPYASEGLYELYRVRPKDVVDDASAVLACIYPDDLVRLEASINKSSEDLSPFKCNFRILFVDGTMRWVAASSLPERESDGSALWYGYMEDATAVHESATELQDAKLRLEEAQALARIGNWTYDVSTMKSCWSQQLFDLFGFEKSELVPTYQQMLDLFYPEDALRLDEAIKTASLDGSSYSVVVRMLHPQSDIRYVRCEGRSRQDTASKILSLYGTAADVTAEVEREQTLQVARDQAEAANLAKSAFLANMSHEIRTPLTAILGFADMLREEVNFDVAPHQRLHTINTITNAGQHLLAIINDVLDLSKIESGKLSVELIETPLIEVLCQVERLLQPKAIGKGVKLNVELSTPVPDRILCDPTRLRQILMNLVGNAVKFTEHGTIVIKASVTASPANTSLVIDIEDTGPGMTAKQSQTLFDAFSQADSTVTRIHGGTGLGLTISRRLANLMGGDVTLQRTGVGQGSCFRIVLPLFPATNSSIVDRLKPPVVSPVSSPTAKIQVLGRILFAEDGLDNQHLISFLLKKAGATIDIAGNGQVALELLDKANESNISYDLLLTDMQMPVMDGYMLASTLRSRGIKMPIIALTAYNLSDDRQKCLDAGCDDYLSKPIDKKSLLAVCAKWITVRR